MPRPGEHARRLASHRPDSVRAPQPHQSSYHPPPKSWGVGSSGESPRGCLWGAVIALEAHKKHLLVIWNSLPAEPSKENDAANCHVASSSDSQKHPWLGPEGALQGIREEKEWLVCLGSPCPCPSLLWSLPHRGRRGWQPHPELRAQALEKERLGFKSWHISNHRATLQKLLHLSMA